MTFLLRNMLSQCRRWKKCHSAYFLSLLSKSESWLEKVSNDGDFLEMKGLNVIITHKLLFAYFGPTGLKLKGAKTNMIFTICKLCCKFLCFLWCHQMFLLDFTSYGAHSDLNLISLANCSVWWLTQITQLLDHWIQKRGKGGEMNATDV